jgi:hypothetical protein
VFVVLGSWREINHVTQCFCLGLDNRSRNIERLSSLDLTKIFAKAASISNS